MENLELSPVEVMETLNWKKSKVYYWINSGKFKTIERNGDVKVLMTANDIERLRKSKSFENSPTLSKSTNSSEVVQENPANNVTKNYEKVPDISSLEIVEFFNKSLETIKDIHQTTIANYGYSMRLLTDGKTSIENDNIELKAKCKEVEESLEKYKKESSEKFEAEKFELNKSLKKFQTATKVLIIVLVCFILSASAIFYNYFKQTTKKPEAEVTPPPVEEVVPKNLKRVPQNNTGNYKGKYQNQK